MGSGDRCCTMGQRHNALNCTSGKFDTCIFCNASVEHGFDIVWEDEHYTVFKDYRPAAAHHLQVIPKHHYESVRILKKPDVDMIQRMRDIGRRILDELQVPVEHRRLGFHVPPFNSVNHLHLHVQAMPYKHSLLRMKYVIAPGYGAYDKGASWFVEAEQAIRILEKGNRVKILSC